MTIEKIINNQEEVLTVSGRINSDNAKEFEEEIVNIDTNINKLIIDMSELEYISSAGLRVLLKANEIMDGRKGFFIKNLNKNVKDTLELVGFTDYIKIID